MCLDSIQAENLQLAGYGFKVVDEISKKNIRFEFYGLENISQNLPNKWLTSNQKEVEHNEVAYKTGFHIFLLEEDAKNYMLFGQTVVKVKFKQGRLLGEQENKLIVVADKIFFIYK
jgi:hypothetical protein